MKRLLSTERSLKKKSKLADFQVALQKYSQFGHAEEVPPEDMNKPPKQHYYMPVHVVYKETSSTTKTRPVFVTSAKTTSGRSLNHILLATPSLLPHISTLITIFRTNSVAITADVGKMFREVAMEPEEKDFTGFLRGRQMDTSTTSE